MKVLIGNSIESLTSTSSNASYPVSNLLNSSPKKRWEAATANVTVATLTAKVSGITGGLGLVAVNADYVTVNISDPNGISWEDVEWNTPGETDQDTQLDFDTPLDSATQLNVGDGGGVEWIDTAPSLNIVYNWGKSENNGRALWVSFDQFSGVVDIEISLRKNKKTAAPISAGRLSVGQPLSVPGVQYPLTEGLIDLSVDDTLANGASYYKDLGRLRYFSGSAIMKRKPYFYNFMRTYARDVGKNPVMISFPDTLTNSDFVMYGRLNAMPEGSHTSLDYSTVNFSFQEVV